MIPEASEEPTRQEQQQQTSNAHQESRRNRDDAEEYQPQQRMEAALADPQQIPAEATQRGPERPRKQSVLERIRRLPSKGPVTDDSQYRAIVRVGDDLVELHCPKCQANCFQVYNKVENGRRYTGTRFYRGGRGVVSHISRAHPEVREDWIGLSSDIIARRCTKRTLTEAEVNAVLKGRHHKYLVDKVVYNKPLASMFDARFVRIYQLIDCRFFGMKRARHHLHDFTTHSRHFTELQVIDDGARTSNEATRWHCAVERDASKLPHTMVDLEFRGHCGNLWGIWKATEVSTCISK